MENYETTNYAEKRRVLREYSIKSEIQRVLNTIIDDLCSQLSKLYYTNENNIDGDTHLNISNIYNSIYKKIFTDEVSTWNIIKD